MPIAILAGGSGTRIGGDKPWAKLGGITLIERAFILAGRWGGKAVAVVRSDDQLVSLGRPRILDEPGLDGPLAGLAAALRWAASEHSARLLTIACDMPFLPDDLPLRLGEALGTEGAAIASSGGQLYPVCGLWRTDAIDQVPAYASTGRRSLRGFAGHVGFAEVHWPTRPQHPFFNINSREELEQAERLVALEG